MSRMKNRRSAAGLALVLLAAACVPAFAGQAQPTKIQTQVGEVTLSPRAKPQEPAVRPAPAIIEQPMADFTLPAYQGGTVSLSQFKGKNVMIIFPRGWAAPDYWCTICNYRYVELAELEKAQQIQKKYNVQVLVIFPYPRETVQAWLEALPKQLESIKAAKYPADPAKLDEAGKRKMVRWTQFFPKDFSLNKGEILDPFPVLVDADHALSSKLDLFRTEWGGGKVDQNIPSVFIVDKNGVLLFKYMGQNTTDRPSYDYLFKVLDVINGLK
jgi:peroxiredoxin